MNSILYHAVQEKTIDFISVYNNAFQFGSDTTELIEKLGEKNVLLFLIGLHGAFRDRERENYEAGVVDFVFIELAKTFVDRSAEEIDLYYQQLLFIGDINRHLADIDDYAKNFGRELQQRLKEEKSKKRILELKATIKDQQIVARKAIATMFGDSKKIKKMTLRQLLMIYHAQACCISLIQHLLLLAEPGELQEQNLDTPWHWQMDEQFGPFEEFVQDRWGSKVLTILSEDQQPFWLEQQSYTKCCNDIIGCRNLVSPEARTEVEVGGFFEKLSEVQQSQWEVLKFLQPPLLDHKFLACGTFKIYDISYAETCECNCCMVWPAPCLGPWFLMWEKMFGPQLMDFILYHHKKITVPKVGNSKVCRQKQQIITENKERETFIKLMMETAKVLRKCQQLDDAPQNPCIVKDLCEFLLDERVIMQLSWSYTLLQQWLSAALHCIIQFEVGSLELRHWGMSSEVAQCCVDILSMVSKVKETLLLALHLLVRQALDYPNTEKHNQFPATIMDKVVLPSLPILEWLCSGKAGNMLQVLKTQAFASSSKPDDLVSLSTSSYTLHEGLMETYTLHYWHLLYWLRGTKEVLLPVCDVELDLQKLLQDLSKPKENKLIPFAIKPLNKEEQQVYDLCVLPSLPGSVDNRAHHFLECAQKAVKKLASVGMLTKKAEKCASNLFNSKKAKAAAKCIFKYEHDMDALTHGMVFSALYCSLNSLLSDLDQNENTLSAVVMLSGELLEKEQLVRMAAVCTSLISTATFSVQTQVKSEQTFSSLVPFWMKHESLEKQITARKEDLERNNTFANMQNSLHELRAASKNFTRDQFWVCIDTQLSDLPTTDTIDAFAIADVARRFLIKIAKDNYTLWENGQEAYKSRAECQYWMSSFITLMVQYVIRHTNNDYDVTYDDIDDESYTDISDDEVSYMDEEESIKHPSFELLLSDSTEDDEEEEDLPLDLLHEDCGSHRDAATSPMIKVEANTECSNSTEDDEEEEDLPVNLLNKDCGSHRDAATSPKIKVEANTECSNYSTAELTKQVHDTENYSEDQIKTTHLSNKIEQGEITIVASTVKQSNTTCVECETFCASQKEVTTYNVPGIIVKDKSILVHEKETLPHQSKLEISGNKSSDCVEKETNAVRAKDISNDDETCIHAHCDHTVPHRDTESNKENHDEQHHHNDAMTACCGHQFTENQHTPRGRANIHKHNGDCQHQHHPKKQFKREKKEIKSLEEKEKLLVMEKEEHCQQHEVYAKKMKMRMSLMKSIKKLNFIDFTCDTSLRCRYFMDFVRLLLSSFQQDFSLWLSSSPKRHQGCSKVKYDASIIEQFNFGLARSDGLLAEYYLTRTWDLLKAYMYCKNEYSVCEPVQGYMNFNNNILSYINGKKEAYMELHPVMQKMLLSLSTEVILPFTKRVYLQLVQACQSPLPGQELKCVQLSDMYLTSQALGFFKLVVDTQMLSYPRSKVEDDAVWKCLQCLKSSICEAVFIVEAVTYSNLNDYEEQLNNYIEECRIYLSVYWQIIQNEYKKCGRISKPALGLENEQSALQTPKFHMVVQSFLQGQLIDVGKSLKLIQTCGEDKNISQIKKESRMKDVHWCRNCLKLEPKVKKGTFIQCALCIEHNYSDPYYFCSEACKEIVNCYSKGIKIDAGMCKHNIEHIEYLLSHLQF